MTGDGLRLALVTLGSLGDVHPLLGLGRAMTDRGHHVTLMTNAVFESLARNQGLGFVAVGSAKEQLQTLNHPKLWHPVDGLGVMWRYMLRPALRPTLMALDAWRKRCNGGQRCLVVSNPVMLGARLAHEAWGVPLVSVYTAATMLRTCVPPMTLAQWRLRPGVPRWMPRMAWAALDRFKLQPLVLPALNEIRAELGLDSLSESVFGHWMHAPSGGLTLFPSWFAPGASDWPTQVRAGDFPLFDEGVPLDAGLMAFLERGTAPVVVMPGSGQMHGADLFRAAALALRASGLRGVFLGPVPAEVAACAQGWGIWCGAGQSFAQLLPRSRVLMHHAGIGSSAQALRAGIPQLVWPRAYDQFDNAWRLEQLGVAGRLSQASPDADRFRQCLEALLVSDASVRARHVARMHFKNQLGGMAGMCEQLEAWA